MDGDITTTIIFLTKKTNARAIGGNKNLRMLAFDWVLSLNSFPAVRLRAFHEPDATNNTRLVP